MVGSKKIISSRGMSSLGKGVAVVAAAFVIAACDPVGPVDVGSPGPDATDTPTTVEPAPPGPTTTVTPGTVEPRAANNAVFNGTFENGLSGWTQVEPVAGSEDASTGAGAGKVEAGGSISQTVFVEPNATYEFSAQIKGTGSLSVNVEGNEQTADVANADYAEVAFTVETVEALEVILSLSTDTEVRVDDVELVKIAGGSASVAPVDPNAVFDFGIWETEGRNPVNRDGEFVFDALTERVLTPNGNGFRHEMKVRIPERVGLTEQFEKFSANIELDLSPGSETIAAQHHPEGLGTLTALYIRDSKTPPGTQVENGIARDGIFDVYVTIRRPDGSGNDIAVLGTVENGDNFDYEVINDRGEVTMTGLGTTATVTSADSSASYFKFGNYLQARNPASLERAPDRNAFGAFYADQGIDRSRLTFRNVSYERIVD